MSDPQYPSGPFPPPPPPVRPNVAEYVKAFNKPLTMDEKAAWLAEIVYRVLHGELPQDVYPALKDHIEALPVVTASKDRPEEKLPGSDYVYPGPPKPLVATTTVFPDAEPIPHELVLPPLDLDLANQTVHAVERIPERLPQLFGFLQDRGLGHQFFPRPSFILLPGTDYAETRAFQPDADAQSFENFSAGR